MGHAIGPRDARVYTFGTGGGENCSVSTYLRDTPRSRTTVRLMGRVWWRTQRGEKFEISYLSNAAPPEHGHDPRRGRVFQRRRPRDRVPRVPLDAAGRGRLRTSVVVVRLRGRSSSRTDRHPTSPSRRPLRREKKAKGHNAVLGHEAVVHGLHVILHFVRPGELLAAYRAREHLPLVALVIEESVPLEAVLVLERFLYVELRALGALINALGDRGVTKEIQPAHGHLGQLFGRILRVGGRATSHASFRDLTTGWCGHSADLVAAGRRGVRRRCRAAAAAAAAAVLRVVSTGRGRRGRTSRGRCGRVRAGVRRRGGRRARCRGQ